MGIEKLSETQIAIIDEISRAFDRLGAERGIFAAHSLLGEILCLIRSVCRCFERQNEIDDNQQRLTK